MSKLLGIGACLSAAVLLFSSCSVAVGPPTSSPIPPMSATPGSATPAPTVAAWPTGTPSMTLTPSANPTPSPRPTLQPTPRPSVRPTASPTASTATCKSAPLVYHGTRTSKVIALTIDDGYSSAAVLADLAILADKRVNATWFPVGQVVAGDPDVWQKVAETGFPVANHTWDHRNLTLMTYAEAVEDIRRANERVSAIIGEPLLPLVRPYGGNWNRVVLCEARTAGERAVVLWDTTFGDTGTGDVAHLVANAEKGTNGSIVLMHANRSLSQQALPTVIDFYRARGFTFVTLGQLLGIEGPVPYP
jgi:peptidoglycan-N-acetylglucosamine deacetylase